MSLASKFETILFLCLIFIVTSCGSQRPMVTDVVVSSKSYDSQVYVSANAAIDIGNTAIPNLTLPIILPQSGKDIGSISIYTDYVSDQANFEVDINVSAIANFKTSQQRLPNGDYLPLIGNNEVIKVPVEDKGFVYLTVTDGAFALGATINLRNLDRLGRRLGRSSVFPMFNIRNVLGSAGIYTSRSSGKNGFGLFVDLSSILDTSDILNPPKPLIDRVEDNMISVKEFAFQKLDYTSIVPKKNLKRRLNKSLYSTFR
ncbi:MAG: hypothetical protein N4A33_07005 [Bacteriovoracaceae bacterium]|jgi:hypothetical protein|nr:hypothetical protein [Bacteriovoracaceae bacterium]